MVIKVFQMDYKSSSDIELWKCCQQDDVKAFNELFRRYDCKLRQLSMRYIKDPMQAEELAMDLLCNLWTKRREIDITTNLNNYIFRAMRNVLINRLKKKLPQLVDLEEAKPEDYLDRPADFRLRDQEAAQRYEIILNTLSPQRRKVFSLSRDEDLTYSEIASVLRLSVNTVEQHMVSALKSLRAALKENAFTTISIGLLFALLQFS